MDYKVKETVTRENIITDLKRECRILLVSWGAVALLCSVSATAPLLFFATSQHHSLDFIGIVLFTILILFVLGMYANFIYSCIQYSRCHKSNYKITSDILKEMNDSAGVHLFSKHRSRVYFKFASHGYYSIGSDRAYYTWAKYYTMDSSGLYKSASINDEFYIVFLNKGISCVYNKKMFELSSELLQKQ